MGFAVATDDDTALLARIDERTEGLSERMADVEERLEKTATKDDLKAVRDAMKTLVSLDRHRPVEMIAYGLAAAVLSTVLNAVLKGALSGVIP